MNIPVIRYCDQWGECIERPDDRCSEIRWFDTTSDMDGNDFNTFLTRFVEVVEGSALPGALVDAVQFRMGMSKMNVGWRDANIVPRYNASGLRKFAFVMPAGMPLIGSDPVKEGPADYPTGYFATRQAALAWLAQ